ncbi:MAG: hypothetical protein KKH88_01680 [Nanoarchaeota archaeon]|nr:hypothetical protein [Nanoarchaeota archaeon]
MRKFICVIICFIFFSFNTYAIGITPGKSLYEFEPGLTDTIEFTILNYEGRVLDSEIFLVGDLKEYFDFEKINITLNPNERKLFTTKFALPPDLDLAPGDHRNLIVVSESIEEEQSGLTTVGAVAAVGYVVTVRVPYEGKYLDVLIQPGEAEINKDVHFKVILEVLGKQTVVNSNGNLKILDKDNKTLTTLYFQENNILFKEKRVIDLVWDGGYSEAGIYNAVLDLTYDEKTKQVEQSFRIGDLLINILDLNEKEILEGKITMLEVSTQSMWNKGIIDVYAELEIGGKQTKSPSVDYERWEEKMIPLYFDPAGLETGEYEAKVTLFYEGKTTEKTFDIKIVSPFFSPTNPLLYLMIVVVILLMVILVMLFKKRKLFKSKAKLE